MNADEINEGLAKYLWAPDYYPVVGSEEIFAAGEWWDLFTDSLDACERVADKLGVWRFTVTKWKSNFGVTLANPRVSAPGPTRAHAFAAALWAAVKEQQNEARKD